VTYTALVVDDEPLARAGLRLLLAEDAEIGAIHDAAGGREAIDQIGRAKPDLVLLDVQMPEVDGLAVIREVGIERMPAVVFATAHDEFALHAFEVNAVDYLLKPVTRTRFAEALARVKVRLRARDHDPRQLEGVLDALAGRYPARFAVRSVGKTTFVTTVDVDWIGAAENYVELHVGAATHLLAVAIGALERSLDPAAFVRVHRSAIVRIDRIRELRPLAHGEYELVLSTGAKLRSSRTYRDAVRALATNPF
jgi:two-component system, LytTR family, response regulator